MGQGQQQHEREQLFLSLGRRLAGQQQQAQRVLPRHLVVVVLVGGLQLARQVLASAQAGSLHWAR
jgi:hypothetical protein